MKSKYSFLLALILVFCILLTGINFGSVQAEDYPNIQSLKTPDIEMVTGREAIPGGEDNTPTVSQPSTTITSGAIRNLRPTESYLHGVSLLPSTYDIDCISEGQMSRGWIVGNAGVILGYCNGLWDHFVIPQSDATDLFSVQAISPTLAVATGDSGIVLMYVWSYTAQDYIWKASSVAGASLIYGVSVVPDGTSGNYTGWAVGLADGSGRGTLIKGTITPAVDPLGHPTHNFTWQNVTANYPSMPQVAAYYSVQVLTPDDVWAAGGTDGQKGVIAHWDGSQWSQFQEFASNLYSIRMLSATNGWAVGSGGTIYHFNGSTWSQVNSPTTEILTGIDFAPNGEGWITGHNGTLLKYVNGTWTQFTDLRTDAFDFRGIDFTSGHGWIAGANFDRQIGGQILEYFDNLWLAVTPPTDNRLTSVSVVSENDAWAVGVADELGGTVIHWDGTHWQRILQNELPIPGADLYSVDMVSASDGWIVGDVEDGKAVFLHWNGYRWARPRDQSPLSTRANVVGMLNKDFGWAMANKGSAVGEYDGATNTWSAPPTCGGAFYNLRDNSIVPDTVPDPFLWTGWAVGSKLQVSYPYERDGDVFLKFMSGCAGRNAWSYYQTPLPDPEDEDGNGYEDTLLYGIEVLPDTSMGYAAGEYLGRAIIHTYIYSPTLGTGNWFPYYVQPDCDDCLNPSRFMSVDIVEDSGTTWFGGYLTCPAHNRKEAYINYIDENGRDWIPYYNRFFPVNGWNIYHRSILDMDMHSDTMGWAVGGDETETPPASVIYLYPHPNLTLSGLPSHDAVRPGNSASYTIRVNSLGGFHDDVTLNVSNLPPGSTYNINPSVINPETDASLTINTSGSTPLGIYYIQILGQAEYHSGDAILTVWRQTTVKLTVTDHPIFSVSPDHGPAGTIVTITGEGFGSDPGAGNRNVVLADKQLPDANVLSWSDTQIRVRVPDDGSLTPSGSRWPRKGIVKVVIGTTESNDDFTFQTENIIANVSVEESNNLFEVTLTGTLFGNDPGFYNRSTEYEHVTFGTSQIPYNNVTNWENNTITFTVPSGTASAYVTLTSNGYQSNAVYVNFESTGMNEVFLPLLVK